MSARPERVAVRASSIRLICARSRDGVRNALQVLERYPIIRKIEIHCRYGRQLVGSGGMAFEALCTRCS
jgi:hypothetical protein